MYTSGPSHFLFKQYFKKCIFMYTSGPSHFLFKQYFKNVFLCKDRWIGILTKLLTEQNNQKIVNCD